MRSFLIVVAISLLTSAVAPASELTVQEFHRLDHPGKVEFAEAVVSQWLLTAEGMECEDDLRGNGVDTLATNFRRWLAKANSGGGSYELEFDDDDAARAIMRAYLRRWCGY